MALARTTSAVLRVDSSVLTRGGQDASAVPRVDASVLMRVVRDTSAASRVEASAAQLAKVYRVIRGRTVSQVDDLLAGDADAIGALVGDHTGARVDVQAVAIFDGASFALPAGSRCRWSDRSSTGRRCRWSRTLLVPGLIGPWVRIPSMFRLPPAVLVVVDSSDTRCQWQKYSR